MDINVIVFLCIYSVHIDGAEPPQVYEDLDDDVPSDLPGSYRVAREPFIQRSSRVYRPPAFNFHKVVQQDPRRHRYAEQQRVDMENIIKKGYLPDPFKLPLFPEWQFGTYDQNFSPSEDDSVSEEYGYETDEFTTTAPRKRVRISNIKRRRVGRQEVNDAPVQNSTSDTSSSTEKKELGDRNGRSPDLQVSESTATKVRSSRKLRPDSFYDGLGANFESTRNVQKRQDHNSHLIYVHPNVIKEHFNFDPKTVASEQDITALNALIGKSPNVQLEGLKKLLESPPASRSHANYVQEVKEYTPITEKTVDIPNPRSRPNVIVEHHGNTDTKTLAEIQAELDETAKAQTEKVLAQAQKAAIAEVEAQHQAIAKMQIEAHNAAFAEIAAHNYQFQQQPAKTKYVNIIKDDQHSLALPLKSDIIAGTHLTPNQNHQARALHQAERAVIAQIHAQNEAILKDRARKAPAARNLKITKTHSITQGRLLPNAYQEVLVQTHQKVIPEPAPSSSNEHETLQDQPYASRYAFGYRIKDFKEGNDFGHEEKRDGKGAKGHYHVLLPDGRLQKVEYYADPTGYHAKVTYENVAHH